MAAVNVSKVVGNFRRGSPVFFWTMTLSARSRTTQLQSLSRVTAVKQVAPLQQLVNPAFRQPMALLSTEPIPKKKPKTYE